jgi:hypothetical protein
MSVLNSSNLRKEQIYLSEKVSGKTEYTSLDEFDSTLRNNSPFEKWYSDGRLGAIPELNYRDIASSVRSLVED